MTVLIGADIVPYESNEALFIAGDAEAIAGKELTQLMARADCRIANLEVPLCDTLSPIVKNGPALSAKADTVNGYKALGIDLVTMANNHILDQGQQGARSTLEKLGGAGIAHVGFGAGEEAAKVYHFTSGGVRVGVYACAEHEFSIARDGMPGANPFDPLDTPDEIAEAKRNCDYLIVLYHGGKEYYRYPSPRLRKVCRRLTEKGADLVVCQHTHCVGCREEHMGGTIVYGQGNFIFTKRSNEYWDSSLLISVDPAGRRIEYIPIARTENGTRLAGEDEARKILDGFEARSREIQADGFVEKKYTEFADGLLDFYLKAFWGRPNRLEKALIKLTRGKWEKRNLKKRYRARDLLHLINYMECEAHTEAVLRGLKDALEKIGAKHE